VLHFWPVLPEVGIFERAILEAIRVKSATTARSSHRISKRAEPIGMKIGRE
jgi:hypothetical protein